MNIILRSEWGAQSPNDIDRYDEPIIEWFTHWVGGTGMRQSPTPDQSKALMRSLQEDAMDEGYDDFEYNFAIDPLGRIFEGRGWFVQSGATLHHNTNSYSVVYLAGPGVTLTSEAQASFLWLTQEGARRVKTIEHVRAHRQTFETQCPGDQLYVFTLQHLDKELHNAGVDWKLLAELAAWSKRRLTEPLKWMESDPDVVTLKALLQHHGYTGMKPGPLYGNTVRRHVHHFKVTHHLDSKDGKICGADCAKALITQK